MLFAPAYLKKKKKKTKKKKTKKKRNERRQKQRKPFVFLRSFFFVGRCVRVLERERERERALFGFPSSSFVL